MTDYNTAVRNATRRLTESGLQFVDYASGVRNHADVAVRRAVLTGLSQYTGKISERNAQELDTDIVEVSAHMGARPDHAEWQGRWYSLSGKSKQYPSLVEVTGYGTGAGLKGWNCRHDFYPVIPGISEPSYTEEELKNIDPPPFEYNGKTYTCYEATQRQRSMERAMRKTKRELLAAESTGDKDRFTEKSVLLRRQREEYGKFSKAAGLLAQNERTQVYGYDRSKSAKTVWAERKASISEKSSKPITPITDKSIEKVPNVMINGYTTVQCDTIQSQHKELLRYSRDNNNHNEVAFVFKNDFTNRKEFIGTDDKLNFGSVLYGTDLFVMHNHPRNSSYSDTDIAFFLSNDTVKSLSIVKNNGKVEVLTKSEKYDKMELMNSFKRCYKKHVKTYSDSEINKAVSAFLSQNKEMIEWIQSP